MALIATLYPADSTGFAAEAITNSERFVPARARRTPRRDERATMSPSELDVLQYLPSCELTFDQPRTLSGIVFGKHPTCDVVLGGTGVSKHHCAITFKKSPANIYRLILRDFSSNGTEVRYDTQGRGVRINFEWILDDNTGVAPARIIIAVIPGSLEFLIVPCIPFADRAGTGYVTAVEQFLRGRECYGNLIDEATLVSGSTTQPVSQSHTLSRSSIFLTKRKLGRGGFGEVLFVWDVSTGQQYACKRPLKPSLINPAWKREMDILRSLHYVRCQNPL